VTTLGATDATEVSAGEGARIVLRWRIVSSTVIVLILVVTCWTDYQYNFDRPGIWLIPLCFLLCGMAITELFDIFSTVDNRLNVWNGYVGVLAMFVPAIFPLAWFGCSTEAGLVHLDWSLLGLVAACVWTFAHEMLRYKKPGGVTQRIGLTILITVYVGSLTCFLAALRTWINNDWGMLALLSMIVVVKFADIGAYATGRLIGRHKLAPHLSPGKTIEGAVGGLVVGCFGSWLMLNFVGSHFMGSQNQPTICWITYGIILTITGLLGDLCESLIKRDMHKKDSSIWLPGLGGILDIMDSVMFAAPAAYACWLFGLLGP